MDLIPSRVKSMTLKLVFTASLLDAQHERDSVKNKQATLFVVSLGKALSGRQVAGNFQTSSHNFQTSFDLFLVRGGLICN